MSQEKCFHFSTCLVIIKKILCEFWKKCNNQSFIESASKKNQEEGSSASLTVFSSISVSQGF